MLPLELREISGLALTADGRLFAHGDEDATVFEIDPRDGRLRKRFRLAPTGSEPDLGKKGREGMVAGDFEDIAIVGDRFFLVTSTGVLLEFAESEDGQRVPYTAHPTGLGERCEMEGLASDPAGANLLLLCKESHVRSERDRVAIYSWSLSDQKLEPAAHIVIPYSAITRSSGDGQFNGSALAFMPGGSSLVLVAGPQRLFAEISAAGKAVGGGKLDATSVLQPEGLAFLPDGTLLISSEGGKGPATLSGYAPRTK